MLLIPVTPFFMINSCAVLSDGVAIHSGMVEGRTFPSICNMRERVLLLDSPMDINSDCGFEPTLVVPQFPVRLNSVSVIKERYKGASIALLWNLSLERFVKAVVDYGVEYCDPILPWTHTWYLGEIPPGICKIYLLGYKNAKLLLSIKDSVEAIITDEPFTSAMKGIFLGKRLRRPQRLPVLDQRTTFDDNTAKLSLDNLQFLRDTIAQSF